MYTGQAQCSFSNQSQQDMKRSLRPQDPVPSSAPSTLVVDTAARVNARSSHLLGLIDRISYVTDRVFGCAPVATDNGEKLRDPQCEAEILDSAIALLDIATERLEQQVRRVEQF